MREPELEAELSSRAVEVFREQSSLVRASGSSMVRAILGTAPFTGGVASLLGDVVQRRQEIRLREFLIATARRIESIEARQQPLLDAEYVRSDEYSGVVEGVLSEVARGGDRAKVLYLQKFMVSAGSISRPDKTWVDLYLKYLQQMSGVHVGILSQYFLAQGHLSAKDRTGGIEVPGRVPLSPSDLAANLGHYDLRLLAIGCVDLCNLGLLVDWDLATRGSAPLQTRFSLSETGKSMVSFIEGNQPD